MNKIRNLYRKTNKHKFNYYNHLKIYYLIEKLLNYLKKNSNSKYLINFFYFSTQLKYLINLPAIK